MKRPMLTQEEYTALLERMSKAATENARLQKWRASELAMTLSDLPTRIKKKFRVPKGAADK